MPLTWSISKASDEFGVSRETIRKRMTQAGVESKDSYSTKEICRAIYGDMHGETLRLKREQADKIAIENATARGELVNMKILADRVSKALGAIKSHIEQAANLEREDKNKIIAACRDLWDRTIRGRDKSGDEPESDPEGV